MWRESSCMETVLSTFVGSRSEKLCVERVKFYCVCIEFLPLIEGNYLSAIAKLVYCVLFALILIQVIIISMVNKSRKSQIYKSNQLMSDQVYMQFLSYSSTRLIPIQWQLQTHNGKYKKKDEITYDILRILIGNTMV